MQRISPVKFLIFVGGVRVFYQCGKQLFFKLASALHDHEEEESAAEHSGLPSTGGAALGTLSTTQPRDDGGFAATVDQLVSLDEAFDEAAMANGLVLLETRSPDPSPIGPVGDGASVTVASEPADIPASLQETSWMQADEEELEDVVSDSSRLIAAWRAVETGQEDSLFKDPLSNFLAGSAAVAQAFELAPTYKPNGVAKHRTAKVSNVAIRVIWFDDWIIKSLNRSTHPSPSVSSIFAVQNDLAVSVALSVNVPKQVVVLGSGMDTRPWRLDLPSGIRWFEVDRSNVLAVKCKLLAKHGAEVPGQLLTFPAQYPMQATSWTSLEADLGERGWSKALLDKGLDPAVPTVWIAEGLLMYLDEQEVANLFQSMADVSAKGSISIVQSMTESYMSNPDSYMPFSKELIDTWKFGCKDDPTEFFAAYGWDVLCADTRARMAQQYGLQPAECSFDCQLDSLIDRKSLFIVSTVNK